MLSVCGAKPIWDVLPNVALAFIFASLVEPPRTTLLCSPLISVLELLQRFLGTIYDPTL